MTGARITRRTVPALLVEATPRHGGLGHWLLASPTVGFLGWQWVDLFGYYSPIAHPWLNLCLGAVVYFLFFVLPLGYGTHRLITGLPRLFQNAGWDVQPLEPMAAAEQYTVRYAYQGKQRQPTDLRRIWLRVAQGWVYLEIAIIFAGALALVPLFLSVYQFGFGR